MIFRRALRHLIDLLGHRERKSPVEDAAILVVVAMIVAGLLIVANHHGLNVYNNIIGGNGE